MGETRQGRSAPRKAWIGIIRKEVREKVDTSAQGRTCQSKWGVFGRGRSEGKIEGIDAHTSRQSLHFPILNHPREEGGAGTTDGLVSRCHVVVVPWPAAPAPPVAPFAGPAKVGRAPGFNGLERV